MNLQFVNRGGVYMKKRGFKIFALMLALIIGVSMPITAFADSKDKQLPSGEILCFGEDLNDAQEAELKKYFNAPDSVKAIYVNKDVAVKQLGLDPNDKSNFTGGWYSSAYVKLNDKETGILVKSKNLTVVTDDMLANALITSGIYNADIMASAPFNVTGESALAGILAGAEAIMGKELKAENKKVAQQEIGVSTDLAKEVGNTESAAIINDVKTAVIKDNSLSADDIKGLIDKSAKKYNVSLSDASKEELASLMTNIKDLDINYSDVKDLLKNSSSKFKDELLSLGKKLNEAGFFEKIFDFFKDLFSSIYNYFAG